MKMPQDDGVVKVSEFRPGGTPSPAAFPCAMPRMSSAISVIVGSFPSDNATDRTELWSPVVGPDVLGIIPGR